ncbi:hypothetical protein AeMF1_021325 [Aphanomyces euteiches]|nr:hypothetical protein AeMF1_021325 [Aphanomyces euteiches]
MTSEAASSAIGETDTSTITNEPMNTPAKPKEAVAESGLVTPAREERLEMPVPNDQTTQQTNNNERKRKAPKMMTFSDLKTIRKRTITALGQVVYTELNRLGHAMDNERQNEVAAVLQAHVNELCSSSYTHLARQYFPNEIQATKKDDAPIDSKLLERIKTLEARIREKEASIQEQQNRMPSTIREIMQAAFAANAKSLDKAASTAVPVVPTDHAIEYSADDIADVKTTFERISAKIDQLNLNLPVKMQEAADTFHVIEHATTRPKTQIDTLMEQEDEAAAVVTPSPPVFTAHGHVDFHYLSFV